MEGTSTRDPAYQSPGGVREADDWSEMIIGLIIVMMWKLVNTNYCMCNIHICTARMVTSEQAALVCVCGGGGGY